MFDTFYEWFKAYFCVMIEYPLDKVIHTVTYLSIPFARWFLFTRLTLVANSVCMSIYDLITFDVCRTQGCYCSRSVGKTSWTRQETAKQTNLRLNTVALGPIDAWRLVSLTNTSDRLLGFPIFSRSFSH